MITIRPMSHSDLPLCRLLTSEAGWNQLDADWHRALTLEPSGCFVAEYNQEPVATTTTCVFGNVGWIAMVLVKRDARGLGIATQLLRHAIDHLKNKKCETIRLDATMLGRPVYVRLGFQSEYEVVRFQGLAPIPDGNATEVITITYEDDYLSQVVELDQKLTGTPRYNLFDQMSRDTSLPVYAHIDSKRHVNGYAAARVGAHAVQVGPAGALTHEAGIEVLNKIITDFHGKPIFMDIPTSNIQGVRWAKKIGLLEQRRFTRMYLGKPITDQPALICACFGPEKG